MLFCLFLFVFYFTLPLLHEFQPALKLFKPLFYLFICMCVRVCTSGEGRGGRYSSTHPFFLPVFFSCLLLQGEELFIASFYSTGVWSVGCFVTPPPQQISRVSPQLPSRNTAGFSPNPLEAVPCDTAAGGVLETAPHFLPKAVLLLPHLSRLLRSGGRGGIPKHNSSLGRNASVLEPAVASPLPKAVRMVTA